MSLALSYAAGAIGALSPCVLPVLPAVSAAALQTHRLGPLVLAFGTILSFTAIGFILAATGSLFGLDTGIVKAVGATIMIGCGALLLFPRFTGEQMKRLLAKLSGPLADRLGRIKSQSLSTQFVIGALLGIVWTPCVGATLGAALVLASQGERPFYAATAMFVFGLGVMSPFLAIAYGLRSYLYRNRARIAQFSENAMRVLGIVLVLIGISSLTGFDKVMLEWAVSRMPASLAKLIYEI